MDKIRIKIKKPRKGWSYHGGELVDLPSDIAKEFVDGDFAIQVPDTEGKDNELPVDLPMRDLLFQEGYESVDSILESQNTLTDIAGVGDKLSAQIVAFCESLEQE